MIAFPLSIMTPLSSSEHSSLSGMYDVACLIKAHFPARISVFFGKLSALLKTLVSRGQIRYTISIPPDPVQESEEDPPLLEGMVEKY